MKGLFILHHESSFDLWDEMIALGGKGYRGLTWCFPTKKARNSALVLCRKFDWEAAQHEASYQTQKRMYEAVGRGYSD